MTEETGVRARTRRAILTAAAQVFAKDRAASLSAVAREAGVGRTTLHRYFPDRAALVRGLAYEVVRETGEVLARADLGRGSAWSAIERVVYDFVAMGERYYFLLHEHELDSDTKLASSDSTALAPFVDLLRRGQDEGDLRSDLPVEWLLQTTDALVNAAWVAVLDGTLARAEAVRAVMLTLRGGISPLGEPGSQVQG
ncbi:TetR/AcrR family transcriptional regulator [Allokutzneria albata]|uniref:DNA-binding transcriptional regulator, AcrR family n=1 Tax=Allokutzneria albata TaxID=211114 RepID=A0A1H0D7K7_ALLAB|nr:TetR/AcrR family transcriptional regulator [Allokutzneria albata]SDN66113.1 DNA-binding transcriptional regulator, AcrR family [Allokutzneria albata]